MALYQVPGALSLQALSHGSRLAESTHQLPLMEKKHGHGTVVLEGESLSAKFTKTLDLRLCRHF